MKKILFLLNFVLCVSFMSAQVFITEIHYDNAGVDIGEGVEISGPATINLSTWSIILYNGSNGTSYNTTTLSGTIPDEGAGFGAVFFPISGMQNGAPDGVALLNGSVVVEFLSYEGSFTATDGSANGITSTNIGVSETSSTPIGESLFLTDSGWMGPSVATPGTLNPGLTVGAPTGPTMSIAPSSFTSLNYTFVSGGPSISQSGVVSGSGLSGIVSGSGIVNFEFSIDDITFSSFPGPISGAIISLVPTTVYVRLKSGLAVGVYNETLTLTNTGGTPSNAASVSVSLTGEVSAPVPDIIINEFHADPSNAGAPAGDANGDGIVNSGDDEFVELYNNEAVAVDISDWTLSENAGLKHTFPNPTIVPAGGFITVFGGGVVSNFNGVGGLVQVASSGSLVLNNGGDGIFLETSSGSLVASLTYGSEAGDNQSLGRDPDITGSFVTHSTIVALTRLYSPGVLNVTPSTGCSITAIAAATPSACSPATNTYSVDVTVTYSTPPATGNIEVNGQSFAVTSSPQTVTLIGLSATGVATDITAVFENDGACTLTEIGSFVAPNPCIAPIPACSDLFFSEYIEGTSNNKCLEIYNPTGSDIDMSLGAYTIELYSNGSTSATLPITTLTGVVPAYGTYVICNPGADPAFLALADETGAATFFNGDDAIVLSKAGNAIDVIGQVGDDPGTNWSNGGVATSELTLIRNVIVEAGDNVDSDPFDPSAEWTALPQDDLSNLGQHNSDCAPFVWTGVASADYHTGSNWTKGAVPVSSEHAWIPAAPLGGVFPIANQDVDLMDLTVRSAASLNVKPTFGLILFGTATNNGTVTLESSALGTAWLDDFTTSTATYTGDISVQTFVTTGSGLGQRYFGSPVVSGAVQGLDGTYTGFPLGQIIPLATCDPNQLDLASPYSNLFEWNENNSFPTSCVQEGWNAISAATNLTPGRSYSGWVNDGSVISLTGAPNTGNTIFATSGVSPSSASISNANGWHLLANPFPSPLDINSVFTSGFVSPQTYDGGSGPFSGTFNPILVSGNNLAVMQGFVARSSGGATFTASQSDRVAGNEVWLRPEFTHMLEVSVLGNNMADRTYVYFDSEATDDFDSIADCDKKESNFGHPTLYTNLDGQRLSLNGYAIDNMNRSVGLGLLPGSNGVFTLDFEGIASFPSTSLIYLEDKLTGDFVNLREQTTYSFAANTAEASNRFEIHFTAPITVSSIDASCEGGDAEIVIDFGMHQVNNSSIEWDYMLEANNSAITNGTQVNGLVTVDEIQEGVYTLVLNQGLYNVNVPVTVSGASTVYADFENPTAIEVGNTINLANFSSGGIDYLWLVEGQSFLAPSFTHTFNNAGTFNIVLEASNEDCEAVKIKTIQVTAKVTGIRDAGDLALANVYTQNSTIVVDLSKLRLPNTSSLEIYNLLGQSIYSGKVGNTVVRIDTKNTSAYYFVTVRNKELQKVFKVLVK